MTRQPLRIVPALSLRPTRRAMQPLPRRGPFRAWRHGTWPFSKQPVHRPDSRHITGLRVNLPKPRVTSVPPIARTST